MGVDLYPTLLDLARTDVPDQLPGVSLKPYLIGEEPADKPRYVFMENQIGFMVTDGRFKYAWYDKTDEQMLIDLKKDTGEEVNLMLDVYRHRYEHMDKYRKLQKALLTHLIQLKQKRASIDIEKFKKNISMIDRYKE